MACLYICAGRGLDFERIPFATIVKFGITRYDYPHSRISSHRRYNPLHDPVQFCEAGLLWFDRRYDAFRVERELKRATIATLPLITPGDIPEGLARIGASGEWVMHEEDFPLALKAFYDFALENLCSIRDEGVARAYNALWRLRDAWVVGHTCQRLEAA